MNSKINYSDSCWKKIRKYFDEKFDCSPFENSDKVKFAKYMTLDNKRHIVSFYNDNRFHKSEFDMDFENLHKFLNELNVNHDFQIHIVCESYIATVSNGDYFVKRIQDGVNYYYLGTNFVDDTPTFDDITSLMQIVKRDVLKNRDKRRYQKRIVDDYDPYSERSIMRDLMNGEGEKHGFD